MASCGQKRSRVGWQFVNRLAALTKIVCGVPVHEAAHLVEWFLFTGGYVS